MQALSTSPLPCPCCPELIARHLDYMRQRGRRDSSLRGRRIALHQLATATGGCLLRASVADLRAWRASLTVARGTVYNRLSHLRSFYDWALDEELLDATTNPARRVPSPGLAPGMPRPISEELLARAITGAPPNLRAVLTLAAFCGLRACEIAALRWQHVLLDQSPPLLLIADGKGGKQRLVPVPPAVVEAMRAAGGTDHVIPRGGRHPAGGANTANAITKLAARYLRDEVGTHYRLHSLRHRFATALYRDTTDLRLTQAMMGHSSPTTTAIYAAYAPDAAYAAMLRIGRVAS